MFKSDIFCDMLIKTYIEKKIGKKNTKKTLDLLLPRGKINHSASICAWAWEYLDSTSVHSVLCVTPAQQRGPGQMACVYECVKRVRGVPHVVNLHSGKLCSGDMPPDLNKPVAAPRVESKLQDKWNGRWMWNVQRELVCCFSSIVHTVTYFVFRTSGGAATLLCTSI